MSDTEDYRWWLLDGDLDVVSDGAIAAASLVGALVRVGRDLERLADGGKRPTNRPYRLIVFKGGAVVAVRPATVGIC